MFPARLWRCGPRASLARTLYSQAMRFATIRTLDGTTAARLDGDMLVPLDAADVGALLARACAG